MQMTILSYFVLRKLLESVLCIVYVDFTDAFVNFTTILLGIAVCFG